MTWFISKPISAVKSDTPQTLVPSGNGWSFTSCRALGTRGVGGAVLAGRRCQ